MKSRWLFICVASLLLTAPVARAAEQLTVGSKAFPEGMILGELLAEVARRVGANVVHKKGLGRTGILWEAVQTGAIDAYVDYTGTISEELLAGTGLRTENEIRNELAKRGILISRPLGFSNSYVLGMKEDRAATLGIRTISDLKVHPNLRFGFTSEFMKRGDGWPSLRDRYQLPQTDVRGMEHALAYPALDTGAIDATDLYSTDAEIRYHGLRSLVDDLRHFPPYSAVILYREDLQKRAPKALAAILQLEGRVNRAAIEEMNYKAKPKSGSPAPESLIVREFLAENPYLQPEGTHEVMAVASSENVAQRILVATGEHLVLVLISLTAAIVVAVPLGIIAARKPAFGQVILGAAGLIQTIPSLALLVFLIPFLGLGGPPAVFALFLYSLLPIIRNTVAGLQDIPLTVRESAEALGLPPAARLRLIELPLASRSILAGIKTSAVINVGTATLGGIIGAGGYGQLIMTGITLNNKWIIMEGAIPAALLALAVQGAFELAERRLVPRGLRLKLQS